MNRLQNKVAIVTGASSGIGRATAKLFAAEGAKVVVAARRQAELDTLVAEIVADGGAAIALAGDVTSESFNAQLVAAAVEAYGRLDIAYNNAGTLGEMGATTGVSEQGWNDTAQGMAAVVSVMRAEQIFLRRATDALRPLGLTFAKGAPCLPSPSTT